MGFLEDLIVGIEPPDYSRVGADLSPEERRLKREEEYLAYQEELRRIWGARGGQANTESASAEKYGLVDRPESPTATLREIAQGRIKGREDVESERKQESASAVDMSDAAVQDDWVRSVGYEPDQDLSNPEKGILVGEVPADKLLRIRKQAAERAPGYTGGEGSFSQQEMTPELASREAENARWLGQQTERDLEYAVTPEMARRNPEYAASAADDIKGLRAQRDMERRTANQEKLVEGLSGGGTVPFETAMKMEAAGMDVPWRAVGMSPQAATSGIEEIFVGAEQNLARIANDLELSNSQGAQETVAYLRYILSNRGRIADMLRRGADPIKTLEDLKEIATRQARDSGALAFWDSNVNQQAVEGQ